MPYAVVDLETTGFAPARGDRIIEVGIVLVDDAGRVESEWGTLVDPQRDVGPTHVHGISASDVVGAPLFGDIAGHVAGLLSGRTVVAHNQAFDMRFLRAELGAHGHSVPDEFAALCTMVWSKREFGAAKLADVCAVLGLQNAQSHAALADARVTADVLAHLLAISGPTAAWRSACETAVFPVALDEAAPSVARATPEPSMVFVDTAELPLWERVTVPTDPNDVSAAVYLELLAKVLDDGLISRSEHWQLGAMAEVAQIASHELPRLHRTYLDAVVDEAVADGVVTPDEQRQIEQIASLLDLPAPSIAPRSSSVATSTGAPAAKQRGTGPQQIAATGQQFTLTRGCRVAFTGTLSVPRDEWAHRAAQAGLLSGSVTKNCVVLVAADPATQSGKAKTALKHGIPIVTEAEFAEAFEQYAVGASA